MTSKIKPQQTNPQTDPDWNAYPALIGSSDVIVELRNQIEKIGPSDASVLIRGESGTGKSSVARLLHELSSFAAGKLVVYRCAGSTAAAAEEALFGSPHLGDGVSGGTLAAAAGGTLVIEELSDLPARIQARLLTTMENGANAVAGSRRVNCRIVATTTRNPLSEIDTGALSPALYYRVSEFQIETPPLRSRTEDFRDLALNLITSRAQSRKRITPQALDVLRRYPFPGNILELKNVIAHSLVFAPRDDIDATDLPAFVRENDFAVAPVAVGESIAQMERRLILATLKHFDGDKQRTAATLGVSVKTLYNRLKSYDRPGLRNADRSAPRQVSNGI